MTNQQPSQDLHPWTLSIIALSEHNGHAPWTCEDCDRHAQDLLKGHPYNLDDLRRQVISATRKNASWFAQSTPSTPSHQQAWSNEWMFLWWLMADAPHRGPVRRSLLLAPLLSEQKQDGLMSMNGIIEHWLPPTTLEQAKECLQSMADLCEQSQPLLLTQLTPFMPKLVGLAQTSLTVLENASSSVNTTKPKAAITKTMMAWSESLSNKSTSHTAPEHIQCLIEMTKVSDDWMMFMPEKTQKAWQKSWQKNLTNFFINASPDMMKKMLNATPQQHRGRLCIDAINKMCLWHTLDNKSLLHDLLQEALLTATPLQRRHWFVSMLSQGHSSLLSTLMKSPYGEQDAKTVLLILLQAKKVRACNLLLPFMKKQTIAEAYQDFENLMLQKMPLLEASVQADRMQQVVDHQCAATDPPPSKKSKM